MYLFTTFMTSPKKDSLFFSRAICEHYVALVKTHFSDLYFRLVKECKTNSRDKFNLYLAKSSLLLFVVFHAFGDIDQVGEAAFAAVLPVMMVGHEDTRTTDLLGTLPPQAGDLALVANLVVLQGSQLDLLVLVFDLLGSGVVLLLALLATATEAEDQVQGGFCKASKRESVKIGLISLDMGLCYNIYRKKNPLSS